MLCGAFVKPALDLQSPEVTRDPYPFFARLRREQPVVWGRSYLGDGWVITRYDDVRACLENPRRFVSDSRSLGTDESLASRWMPKIGLLQAFRNNVVSTDDPQHKRLRNLVHKAFTPKRVEALQATATALVDKLLSAAARKGQFDLIADFALPLPLEMISIMLGVSEADRGGFHKFTSRFLQGSVTSLGGVIGKLPAIWSMLRILKRLIRMRRENPADDLFTALVQAEEAGDHLNEDELVSMVFVLLLAGHETTVNLIASGMLALMQHRSELERLRARADLIDTAIEEILRFTNPVVYPGPRFAAESVRIAEVDIRRGEAVIPLLASANRDESQFPDPDRFDIGREPNRHLAFGMGIHYCLGAPLARLEGRIAFLELVRRFPNLTLAVPPESLRWRSSIAVRGLYELPVRS
jgi:cytochrome P450 PksS